MNQLQGRHPRLFLDANVLISAAWKEESKVSQIWRIPGVDLLTSDYVLAECRRNVPTEQQQARLDRLLTVVEVVKSSQVVIQFDPPPVPEKDLPVLAAAILAQADYLVTGDRKHFGAWYGTVAFGLRIEPPGSFPELLDQ